MTGSESTAKRKFTSKHSSRDDASQSSGVLTRCDGVSSPYAKHIKHSRLGLQNGTATQRTDFNGGHGNGDLKGTTETI